MGSRDHRYRYRSSSEESRDDRGRKERRRSPKRYNSGDRDGDRYYRSQYERRRRRSRSRSRSRSPNPNRRYDSAKESSRRRIQNDELSHEPEKLSSPTSQKNKGPSLPPQDELYQASHGGRQKTILAKVDRKPDKQKPNFKPTGLLAAASNSVTQADGSIITLNYHEPPEARKPSTKDEWRLFVFKGSEILETIELFRKTCWLIGREMAVVDVLAEHPSISKQHAVIQFRYIEKIDQFGLQSGRVRPYIIDLKSSNGTLLNKEAIPESRYLELRDKDMIQFGYSTREYVLINAHAKQAPVGDKTS
ncbi:FHA domain-containing protein DDL [Golovinomyces cichoracearum]|uniref:FHA domain-containing protein DDL n=1 Tax=Golovinomyces cichoracearum TaxID=62708 RepID=A0A420ICV8_9PEZI|nr:FHA domain-containing protein DDL [Golovinomyces cichoracearum]